VSRLGPLLATGLLSWLLMGTFTSQLEVNADTERDLFRATALVEQGQWPDGGPAVDYLPVTLGPGWYVAVAPALAIDPAPRSVHVLHVILLVLGLVAVWRALEGVGGEWGAATIGVLLAGSTWLTDVLVRIWHNGMVPGMALLWLGLLWAGTTSAPRRAMRAIAAGWLVVALLLQLHLVNAAYAVIQGLVTLVHWRKHGWRPAPVAAALSATVGGGLALGYTLVILGLDLDMIRELRAERLGGDASLWDLAVMVFQVLSPAWSEQKWIGPVVAGLAALGLGRAAWQARQWGFDQWVALLALLGLVLAAAASGLAIAPRYLAAAIPAIWVLAARGIGDCFQRIPIGYRPALGWVLVAAACAASLMGQGTPIEAAPPLESPLTLNEQQVIVDVMQRQGISLDRGGARAHGAVFGPLTATRYLAWSRGELAAPAADDQHLFAAPEGWPEPSGSVQRQTVDGGSGRKLVLVKHSPRFNALKVRASVSGTPCPITLPWRWSHLTAPELEPFGIRIPPGIEQCRQGDRQADLTLAIPPIQGDGPVHLVVQWFDVAGRRTGGAHLQAQTGGRPLLIKRLGDDRLKHAAMWQITPQPGRPLSLTLGPLDTIATLDLY
jgi:hypothetical protein